jgi:hypothetical protein
MQLDSEVANLSLELKGRYLRLLALHDATVTARCNQAIATLYALSCGSMVVALNAVGGKNWRKVLIDRKAVKALAVNLSGKAMLDRTLDNIAQFTAITAAIRDPRTKAAMNRYLAEWNDAVDGANRKLHAMGKARGV